MRALSRNTRRVTALTLAAALVIAVYLNWQYARADITPQTEDDTLMVSAEPVEADAETTITDAVDTQTGELQQQETHVLLQDGAALAETT